MKPGSDRSFGPEYRGRVLAVAIVGNLVPISVATATDFSSHRPIFFAGAVVACIVPIVVTLSSRSQPVLFYGAAYGGLPALMLMQAYSGGAASGYSVLMMMAMIWFGLQATDRELLVGLGVLAACSYLPMLVIGPPAYPVDVGHATLLVLVGSIVAGSLRTLARETQRLTDRLRREATVDDLTGLLNRRGWEEGARREFARATRSGHQVGLVTLDLDSLKEINDSMGHDEGDRVLRETGDRLRRALRATDVVARLGGDEFVALLTESSLDEALAAVQRLRDVTPPRGVFSAGVAAWDGHEDLADFRRRADVALYAAKAGGGHAIEVAPLIPAALDDRSTLRAT